MKDHIVWLICTVAVASTIPACLAFNIDTRNPEVFLGEPGDFFGYRVLQYLNKSSNNKGIVVTAPLRLNGSGGIYQPHQNKWFSPSGINRILHNL